MKLKTLLEQEGPYTGYDCRKCRNNGFIPYIKNGEIVSRECDCRALRKTLAAMERSGLKDVLQSYSFDRFQAKTPWQAKAKQVAEGYAQDPKGWFFMGGQSGSGKTHLCTAIAGKLMLEGRELVYMAWCQSAQALKAGRYESREAAQELERIKNAPVLYIDDLLKTPAGPQGRTNPTGADIMLAFEILNHRYLQDLPTVISTELYPEELTAIDEALAGRILEKAAGNLLRISRDMSKNWRMKSVLEL
ncbi:MAG: ATP-binding protein [Oscillospiraceae bacterium]|nr:ATP-binding protein [Oscillospiraceae bacterium]